MDKTISNYKFYSPQVNFYVKDVEASAQFYINNFGFTETFRTPKTGNPIHIELKLEQFILGVGLISAAENMHGLKVGTGLPKSEVVLWTDDADGLYKVHTFLNTIRAAWIADPDGNPVQIVSKIDE